MLSDGMGGTPTDEVVALVCDVGVVVWVVLEGEGCGMATEELDN